MIKKISQNETRLRRHARVRRKISGTSECPRLSVYRSLSNIYAQVINDTEGKTVVSASTLDSSLKGSIKYGGNKTAAAEVGRLVAEKALEKGIKKVVFDRGGFLYHGRVKELADAARKAGLEF